MAQGRRIISSEARVLAQDGRVLAHGVSTIMVLGDAKG
jgi:acyl-coenzyme A thioesterase PaaI-like protein